LRVQSQEFVNQEARQANVEVIPELTLFGHSARIWDCYISESVSLPDPFWPSHFGNGFAIHCHLSMLPFTCHCNMDKKTLQKYSFHVVASYYFQLNLPYQLVMTAGEDCTCCI
jgi:hypothetical protein